MDFESTPETFAHWGNIVEGIRDHRCGAIDELYTLVVYGSRPKLLKLIGGQHADDQLHEVVLIVLKAIYRGDLREPERFLGFVRTITKRRVFAHIRKAVSDRKTIVSVDLAETAPALEHSPEARVLAQERTKIGEAILARLGTRDREIMTRFYYHEQDRRKICAEMGLTDTQFRLFKSRALAKCTDLGRRRQQAARLQFS